MTVYEPVRDDEGLIHELFDYELRSVESFDSSAADMAPMIVVGKKTKGAITSSKVDVVGANKGAVTLTDTLNAVPDVYKLICVEPYQASGTIPAVFEVVNSKGEVVGVLTAGVAFAGPTGTITKAVGTADAAGDIATVTVAQAAGPGTIVPLALDPNAADGSGVAYGVSPRKVRKSASLQKGVVIVTHAVMRDNAGFYPAGADANRKAAIRAELFANKLIRVKPAQNVA